MYELEFEGLEAKKLVSNISVVGNNKADVVRFVLKIAQQSISLSGYNAYIKVESKSGFYFNKEKLEVSEGEEFITLDWTLTFDYTKNRHLTCQLQFQSDDTEEVVWQSKIFYLELNSTLDVDGRISSTYPTILSQLEKEVNEKADKVGPLPTYTLTGVEKIFDFIEEHNLWSLSFTFIYNEDTYIAKCNKLAEDEFQFGFYPIGELFLYWGEVVDLTMTFGSAISSTHREIVENIANKVNEITSSSTNNQYPSARAVWNVKGTKLYKHEVVGKDSNGNVLWTLIIHDYIQTRFYRSDFAHSQYDTDKRLYAGKFLSITYMFQPSNIINYEQIHFNAGFGVEIIYRSLSSDHTLSTFNNLDTVTDTVTEL